MSVRDGSPHDRVIDEILDGDLSPERSQALLRGLRHDARACEALARTRIGIERLREPVDAPDLADQILGRVHARRRFLPARARKAVTAGRLAVAAGLVGAVALASFVQRHAPQVRLADDAAPVSRIVSVTEQSTRDREGLDRAVASIEASLAAPVRSLSLDPHFRPEKAVHFDLSLDRARPAPRVPTAPRNLALGAPRPLEEPPADSTLISRFGSLLVILREPPPTLDDQSSDD